MVELEQAAQAFGLDSFAGRRSGARLREGDRVGVSGMVSFVVSVRGERGDGFFEGVAQGAFAEQNHSVEAFRLEREKGVSPEWRLVKAIASEKSFPV
jgi:hypothetical protein